MIKFLGLFIFLAVVTPVNALTITEKKQSCQKHGASGIDEATEKQLAQVNQILIENRAHLQTLYEQLAQAYYQNSSEDVLNHYIQEIKTIKSDIAEIQRMWREETASFAEHELYALWHQPETTILQLIMDYSGLEAIYLVPPHLGSIPVSLNSNLLIPKESWNECLELILQQNGIGIRQLNPFLRELYEVSNNFSGLKLITEKPEDLNLYPVSTRICFVLDPHSPDPRQALNFLERFSNPSITSIRAIGGKIFIASTIDALQELLKLYDFVKTGTTHQECQLVALTKINANEMETILNSAFAKEECSESSLKVIPLSSFSQSLFLNGTKNEVQQAVKLIRELEAQIEDPQEKTVFWYTVKHSEAEELASLLAKVYDLLCGKNPVAQSKTNSEKDNAPKEKEKNQLIVPATLVTPTISGQGHQTQDKRNNFIVDPKTGSLVMVVEQEALPKIKELLKKLDVPKKMIQLEVLLFEKKITSQTKFGLNLLKLGSSALNTTAAGLTWNPAHLGTGILEFFISHAKGSGIPAYDLAYHFLLGQEDVQINASPSTITMNQTPATFAIVEEISINAGADEKKQQIYNRAQYGITIQITPSVNTEEHLEDETPFVTLDTNITFDTTKKNVNDRPDVTRRHIKNHVRIADGQTVVLGGLRRKNTQDTRDTIPFLGEIPGIGKFFSTTDMSESSTEMFVFITPKIINDPIEDIERIKKEELAKRPGDIPEFIHELVQAKSRQKQYLFSKSLNALFGSSSAFSTSLACGEYDGRN